MKVCENKSLRLLITSTTCYRWFYFKVIFEILTCNKWLGAAHWLTHLNNKTTFLTFSCFHSTRWIRGSELGSPAEGSMSKGTRGRHPRRQRTIHGAVRSNWSRRSFTAVCPPSLKRWLKAQTHRGQTGSENTTNCLFRLRHEDGVMNEGLACYCSATCWLNVFVFKQYWCLRSD